MRPVRFLGDSLKCLRDFTEDAKQDAGYQLDKVQRGEATGKREIDLAKKRFAELKGTLR
jgi:phage-related protein